MKNILVFLYLILFIEVHSQGLNSISASDNNNILSAGNGGKLLYSSNGGSNWVLNNLGSNDYKSVASIENIFYVCGTAGTIVKGYANEFSFLTYNAGTSLNLNSIFFIDSSKGFTCGETGSVFKTTNSGVNWTIANTGIPSIKLNSISFKDISNGITVGDNGKIFITTNSGQSWSEETSPTTNRLLKVKYFLTGYVIAGENGTLLSKRNGGVLSGINLKTNSSVTGVSGFDMDNVHICGGGGFIRNILSAVSDYNNFEQNPLIANASDINYLDSQNGWMVNYDNNAIIRTTNGGSNWNFSMTVNINYSLENKLTIGGGGHGNTLCLHPKSRNTIFVAFNQNIFVSRNNGDNWTQISTIGIGSAQDGANCFYVSPIDTNIWLCLMRTASVKGRIVRTTNYGSNWNIILDTVGIGFDAKSLEMNATDPSVFYYIPKNSGVYKSTDIGATFNRISNFNFNVTCDIYSVPDSLDLLFANNSTNGAFTDTAEVFKSTNGGLNWISKYRTLAGELPTITGSKFRRNSLYVTDYKTSNVIVSENLGDDWNGLSVNSTGLLWPLDICREDPTFIIISRFFGNGLYLSTNSGAHFLIATDVPVTNPLYAVIAPERNTLIGLFSTGISKVKLNYSVVIGITNISTLIPSQFILHQNYPNPFNPNTNIKIDIPSAVKGQTSDVKLTVYNTLGKEITVLINERLSAGMYQVTFDGSNLSSGTYFYRLETEGFQETKRMILLK